MILKNKFKLVVLILVLISNWSHAKIYNTAKETQPLTKGHKIPNTTVKTIDGKSLSILDLASKQASLIVFYRGGWCPYCNKHLGNLQSIESELKKSNIQILAISPDSPENLKKTLSQNKVSYTLLSDSSMETSQAFGLAFKLDDATLEKYKGYGIDLEKSSGYKHHSLPVPSAFLINKAGEIVYAYSDADYKVRIKAEEVLEVVKKMGL